MSANGNPISHSQSISWILIATILLVAILPAHYHLHHLYDDEFSSADTAHAHVIDLHVLTDLTGQSHHDDEAASIAAIPDGVMKKSSPDFSPFILLAMALLLLAAFNTQINIRLHSKSITSRRRYPHFTPLLRAPPLY